MNVIFAQLRYEHRIFTRNMIGAFFTVAFPLFMVLLFNVLIGEAKMRGTGGELQMSRFYVPSLCAFAVIGACYTNIAMSIAIARDGGILKRFRGTPLPTTVLMGTKIVYGTFLGVMLVLAILTLSAWLFDTTILPGRAFSFACVVLIGCATFTTLGLAITAVIPRVESAAAIVQASVLPLIFVSDVFFPISNAPDWLQAFSEHFPIKHFSASMQYAFNPQYSGTGFELKPLLVMGTWCAVGLLVTLFWFRWEPKR